MCVEATSIQMNGLTEGERAVTRARSHLRAPCQATRAAPSCHREARSRPRPPHRSGLWRLVQDGKIQIQIQSKSISFPQRLRQSILSWHATTAG